MAAGSVVTQADLWAFGLAVVSAGAVFLVLAFRKDSSAIGLAVLGAVAATLTWAALIVWAASGGPVSATMLSVWETLRSAAWVGVLVLMLARGWQLSHTVTFSFVVSIGLGFLFSALLLIDSVHTLGWSTVPAQQIPDLLTLFFYARLLVATGGIVLVHNLFVGASSDLRWELRMLCIGLAGLFAYDVHLYAMSLLYGSPSPDLLAARGVVQALVLPLIAWSAFRSRSWSRALALSRQVVFQSVSLVAIGGYLLLMSAAAYGLRLMGGDLGGLLQTAFLFAMLLLLAVVFLSGRVRSWLKVKISKHFFALKYDYREEWLGFITTASGADRPGVPLEKRIVQAIGDIVDSPGGALWLPDETGRFEPMARWNFRTSLMGVEDGDGGIVRYLSQTGRIIDFAELGRGEGDYGGMALPGWAVPATKAWLGVPLIHNERLAGFVVLEQARAARSLNWEDFDLLRTVGRQAASYIAEAATQRALLEAGKFDEFNRRFAFIMHDIKNLVSQLSLVLRNAERHADNPEFQRDMMLTLKDSVGKMNDLLQRLGQHNTAKSDVAVLDVGALLRMVVAEKSRTYRFLTLGGDTQPAFVRADGGRLEQVFQHVVQNAIDAAPQGRVNLSLQSRGESIVVEISDTGTGMSEEFVRDQLFQPFQSTKPGGFGIGAYEAREIVRALGGHLAVRSVEGEGTTFTVILPAAVSAAPVIAA
jgi:putative PEP-CTERM system histidine kinase